jgi:hypothetical protein
MKVDRLAGIASSTVVAVAHVSADGVSILRVPVSDRSRRARRLASRCGWCELVVAAQVAVELRNREGAAAVAARVDQAPDEIYAELELQSSPEEIAALTFQICVDQQLEPADGRPAHAARQLRLAIPPCRGCACVSREH